MAEVKTLRFLALGSLLGLALLAAPACSGQPGTLCDLQCECEHCNDVEEDVTCEAYATQRDVSEIYDCLAEWRTGPTASRRRAPATRTRRASPPTSRARARTGAGLGLSLRQQRRVHAELGRCLLLFGRHLPGANLHRRPRGYTCATSDECPDGEDRCGDEAADLAECIDDASDMGQTFG